MTASGTTLALIQEIGPDILAELFLVSKVAIESGNESPRAVKSNEPKCPRCWRRGHGVGSDEKYAELCDRCAAVVRALVQSGELTLSTGEQTLKS